MFETWRRHVQRDDGKSDVRRGDSEMTLMACHAASYLVRKSTCKGYKKFGRSMLTADVLDHIVPQIIMELDE